MQLVSGDNLLKLTENMRKLIVYTLEKIMLQMKIIEKMLSMQLRNLNFFCTCTNMSNPYDEYAFFEASNSHLFFPSLQDLIYKSCPEK